MACDACMRARPDVVETRARARGGGESERARASVRSSLSRASSLSRVDRRWTVERGRDVAMAEDEDDPAVFWPLFETTGSDANEFGEDVGFVRDAMRCDAMRFDAMGWDGMGWDAMVGGGRRSGDEGERGEARETRDETRGKRSGSWMTDGE